MAVRLTVKGKEQMLKLVAGEITTIDFTNMSIGSGGYTSAEITAGDITSLKNIIVTTSIQNSYTDTGVDGNAQLYLDATFQNNNVADTFEIREVGIFALDEEDNEYLYNYDILADDSIAFAIMQSKIIPQYMPISLDTGLSDISQANLSVQNDLAIINKEEFDRFRIDVDNKDTIILDTAKTYTDNELNSFEIEVDNKDTAILNTAKTYTNTSVATKANISHSHASPSHSHSLSSSHINGILPIAKGGTGTSSSDKINHNNRYLYYKLTTYTSRNSWIYISWNSLIVWRRSYHSSTRSYGIFLKFNSSRSEIALDGGFIPASCNYSFGPVPVKAGAYIKFDFNHFDGFMDVYYLKPY